MERSLLPAGLLLSDSNVEIFVDKDQVFMQQNGQTKPFKDFPENVLDILWKEIQEDTKLYVSIAKRAPSKTEMIRIFCKEHLNEYDAIPDIDIHRRICNRESDYLKDLTKREIEVIKFATTTDNMKGVEESLDITLNTLKTHLKHIYQKLELKGIVQLTRWACQHKLITI